MRPLVLRVRGLRSYRGECTIDFRDRGLIAIVGDTGAGKSSILEAITYALYNATTWDQRAVGQLISDGAQSMSVELEFQARGEVWSVHRACHRSASRPSTHRLRCLTDPAAEEHDGEAAVSRQVERLMGMTYQAYHAAVVLPQGRFQTLLQETRSRRTAILEGIFRLTDLRGVREAARELGHRAEVAVAQLTSMRGALLPDPAAEAEALRRELDAVAARESELAGLREDQLRVEEAAREAARRVAALREHAGHVARVPAAGLAELVPVAEAIAREMAEVDGRAAGAGEAERRAAAAAAEAARTGRSVEDLAAAAQRLEGVRQALADLGAADRSAEQERAEVDADAAALAAAEAALPELAAAADDTAAAAGEAGRALEDQRALRRAIAEALAAARAAAAAHDAAAGERAAREEALPGLRAEADDRERSARESEAALAAARRALDEARRRDAAAHAAEGLRTGDPCPVCGRALGDAFQAPAAGVLSPLEQAARETEAALHDRRIAATTAANRLDEAERRLAEAATTVGAAAETAHDRLGALRDLLPTADLAAGDAEQLGPIDDQGKRLAAEAAALADDARHAGERRQEAQAEATARRRGLEPRRARLERERGRIGAQRERCGRDLAALGEPGAAGPADLDEPIAAARERLAAARRAREELDGLRAQVARLGEAAAALRRRLADEVETPRGLALRAAGELRLRVDDGLRALGRPPVDAPPAAATIAVEARWADGLARSAADLRAALDAEIEAVRAAGAAAAAGLAQRLEAAGVAGALEAELRALGQETGRARAALEAAEAQAPAAADLDGRIATGAEIRDSLSELHRLLQDGQFVGHVIERRQRQLLVVASRILGSMTGDAYGFSPDFEIVDRFTNQPRPTRTLSGGETFLASLALALALVEIAGRSGTQLDALFLDEGFGSLDASALDQALSALELQASGGRLVAVVSHIRAVAERIETVLEVTRTAAGSRAEWREPTERDRLLADELEARLLA
ncbi:MAG TPA: SMC family ATPase [Candidatus Dormibacteraeota bacterium]